MKIGRLSVALLLVAAAGASGASQAMAVPGAPAPPVDATNVNGWTGGAYVPVTPVRVFDSRTDDGATCITAPRTITIANLSPSTAAVTLNVTVTRATRSGHLSVTPGGTPASGTSSLNYGASQTVPNAVTVQTGPGGSSTERTITLTASAGCPHVLVDLVGANADGPARAGGYTPTTPSRVFDSRTDDGAACISTPRTITITDVPVDTAAVALNVTVTRPTRSGHLTVTPGDTPASGTSNLNYAAGQTVPNAVTVATAPGATANERTIMLTASTGCPHVLVDLAGTYTAGPAGAGGLTAITPARVFDSRTDDGGTCIASTRTVQIPDLPDRTGAVTLNVTVTQPSRSGHLTITPGGTNAAGTSNLNYAAGQTIPNSITTATGPADTLTITASSGCPHVIIDLAAHTNGAPGAITPAVDITTGSYQTCALTADGRVACSGARDLMDLETMNPTGDPVPELIAGLDGVVQLSGGVVHSCARRYDGTVSCWGNNEDGQLGTGDEQAQEGVVDVLGIDDAIDLDAGQFATCVTRSDRSVWCWGYGSAVGGDEPHVPTPLPMPGVSGVKDLALHSDGACVLHLDGTITCWGTDYDENGLTGPAAVPGVTDAAQIDAGWGHACAVLANGNVTCWGDNQWGLLGDGTEVGDWDSPVTLDLEQVTDLSIGVHSSCVTQLGGSVWCWGTQPDTEVIAERLPRLVTGIDRATGVAAGYGLNCAAKVDGTIWCWGDNELGQLGDLTTIDRTEPVQVQLRVG